MISIGCYVRVLVDSKNEANVRTRPKDHLEMQQLSAIQYFCVAVSTDNPECFGNLLLSIFCLLVSQQWYKYS